MKKWMVAFGSLLLVLSLAVGCGPAKNSVESNPAPAGNTSEHAKAQSLFQAKCTACHGRDMKANVDLTKVGSRYKSADEIRTVLIKGKDGMPGGLVTEAEAKMLADWLITMK